MALILALMLLAAVAVWLLTEKLRWEMRWKRLGRLADFDRRQGENLSQHHKDEWVLGWWSRKRQQEPMTWTLAQRGDLCEGRR